MDKTGVVADELKGLGIQLYSGGWLWFDDPAPDDILIEDIAGALSKLCRYTGHTTSFYSVAQHSVLVSRIVPERLAFPALMHDATEAYIGDMSRPLKHLVLERAGDVLRALENSLHEAINKKFGVFLEPEDVGIIKAADNVALATEKRDLLRGTTEWPNMPDPLDQTINPWSPIQSEAAFLGRFYELRG